ncbi:hypothetical protein AVEN_234782-1 [Araneus ventricosus]|uniref:PiggyBac transposable element-derived protein domain-containing protein n=1 Tax=Araneus ventricosus TaxID=182803 RepID=A0A4Y2F5E9_ARAVE|nr:hypothetical protein AVEN_234782-1 [Araneus ventricosus]
MTGTCLSNILDLADINGWVINNEIIGTKIKRRDYILNLAEELRKNYASSKRATLSDFTPSTDDGPTASSRKSKQCKLNQCRNKTIYISWDAKRSVYGSYTEATLLHTISRSFEIGFEFSVL